jgi:hypothetical protein
MDGQLLTPEMQYGFAALCVMLIGVIVWLIKRNPSGKELLEVLSGTNDVIKANTAAINLVKGGIDDHEQAAGERLKKHSATIAELRDKLIARPCIAKEE